VHGDSAIFENSQPEFISVREYLTTSYRPDCDYVTDGSRSGTWASNDHGYLQALLAHLFMNHRERVGV